MTALARDAYDSATATTLWTASGPRAPTKPPQLSALSSTSSSSTLSSWAHQTTTLVEWALLRDTAAYEWQDGFVHPLAAGEWLVAVDEPRVQIAHSADNGVSATPTGTTTTSSVYCPDCFARNEEIAAGCFCFKQHLYERRGFFTPAWRTAPHDVLISADERLARDRAVDARDPALDDRLRLIMRYCPEVSPAEWVALETRGICVDPNQSGDADDDEVIPDHEAV